MIEKINNNKFLKLIVNILALSSIISWVNDFYIKTFKMDDMSWEQFDLFGLITAVITSCLILFLIQIVLKFNKRLIDFENQQNILSIISYVRNKNSISNDIYKESVKDEYNEVRKLVNKKFKKSSNGYINHILSKYYHEEIMK